MKPTNIFLLSALTVLATTSVLADEIPPPLTEAEATAIVEAQVNAKNAKELDRRQRILAVDSDNERLIQRGKKKTLLRRVESKYLEKAKASPEKSDTGIATPFSELLEEYEFVNISLSSTVYDDEYTQVTWRDEDGVATTVWVNLNFKYFSTISSFQLGSVKYSYFGFTHEIDTNAFITHPETGEKIYPHNLPDWMPSADDFPSVPAYLVLAEEDAVIPDALYQQMDALIIHFINKELELKAAYQRAEALRKAKANFLKANPQPEKDIVINYWPIKSNSDL